jgi:hypothetical protein
LVLPNTSSHTTTRYIRWVSTLIVSPKPVCFLLSFVAFLMQALCNLS